MYEIECNEIYEKKSGYNWRDHKKCADSKGIIYKTNFGRNKGLKKKLDTTCVQNTS
jgi:hypothetical protein